MKKNKTFLIFLGIIGVILFALIVYFSVTRSQTAKQISTVPIIPTGTIPNVSEVGVPQPVAVDVSTLSNQIPDTVSQKEKSKIAPFLPINVQNFETSVGITTNFNIFSIDSEPSQVIHAEVYGINYYLSDATTDNPQAVAFIESFNQIKKLLSDKGVDVSKLQILYGNREYIQSTAENWIKTFNLLP